MCKENCEKNLKVNIKELKSHENESGKKKNRSTKTLK